MDKSWLTTAIVAPVVAFALYRRVRRSFGRQRFRPRAMFARVLILCAICVLFLAWLPTAWGLVAAVIGAASGSALAWLGLRHTHFEKTVEGVFYTPNRWIGLGVTALFIGRIAARIVFIYENATTLAPGESPFTGMHRSPLTLGIYFLLAAYYIGSYLGVLQEARRMHIG